MAARHVYTPEADAWLREHYGQGAPVVSLLPEFEQLFGWKPTQQALVQHCWRLGCRKEVNYGREAPKHAVRSIKWKAEPEMHAWMLANDDGTRSVGQVSRGFAEAFGFPLSRLQITYWRINNDRQVRRSPRASKYAVGDELVRSWHGGNYVMVKVAENPVRPGTRDNWRLKHLLVWEQANGCEVPPDMCIVFADHDKRNFAPDNLVAVPRRLMGRLNSPESPEWNDAATLRSAMAFCELNSAVYRAERRRPRTCGVCGKEFAVPEDSPTNPSTCPDCLAAGHKTRGERRPSSGPLVATCAVCGEEFRRHSKSQVRCDACIRKKPKHAADRQRATLERRMRNAEQG